MCLIFMISYFLHTNTYIYSDYLCSEIVKITECNMQNYHGKLKGLEYEISSVNTNVMVRTI